MTWLAGPQAIVLFHQNYTMRLNKVRAIIMLSLVGGLSFSFHVTAQPVPKNYISGLALYDASNASIGGAVEYERWLLVKKNWTLAVKSDYVFPHKTFNAIFSADDIVKSNKQLYAMAMAYYFPGRKNEHDGFFIALGGGINYTWYEMKVYGDYNNPNTIKTSKLSGGHEFNMGVQLNLKGGGGLRIVGGIANFYSKQERQYPNFLPIVLIFTKLSIGF